MRAGLSARSGAESQNLFFRPLDSRMLQLQTVMLSVKKQGDALFEIQNSKKMTMRKHALRGHRPKVENNDKFGTH